MKKTLPLLCALSLLPMSPNLFAGDLGINVILSSEIQPGVYGQIELGNAPRPVLVYEQPRVIVVDRRYAHAEPVYLHVPPGHAKHWDKHCREYNACYRPVYFVRSDEYEPDYRREDEHYDRDDDDHDHGHGHGHKHNRD